MQDEIPNFDALDEPDSIPDVHNEEVSYQKTGTSRRSNALAAVIACVITGLLMVGGYAAAKQILPDHSPDARSLAAATIEQVNKSKSFTFEGSFQAETSAKFLESGEAVAFKGQSAAEGFRLEVGEGKDSFELTVSKNMIFAKVNGEWVKMPQSGDMAEGGIKKAIARPDEIKTPVLFSLEDLEVSAVEGPEIDGVKTWEIRVDTLSLFGEQAWRLAPVFSGSTMTVYTNRDTNLPVKAEFVWAANAEDNKQLEALGLGAKLGLKLDVKFENWGREAVIEPPKKYKDIKDFTLDKEGVTFG